jgi:hypothetical protein
MHQRKACELTRKGVLLTRDGHPGLSSRRPLRCGEIVEVKVEAARYTNTLVELKVEL